MKRLIDEIARLRTAIGRPVKLMEVCGTHTVAIFRQGIRGLIPPDVRLISGPGCPVCVTAIEDIDAAIQLSQAAGVRLLTFGDMMRVPGGKLSLMEARAGGASVDVIYSPMDALQMAKNNAGSQVVFFATGFETTSPLIAATLEEAERAGVENFFIYSAHKLVPPALSALLDSPEVLVDGFILPGHVSAIIGKRPYEFLAGKYRKPGVITGFTAEDILEGIYMILKQIAAGRPSIEIQYRQAVKEEGNPRAVSLIEKFFQPEDAHWRGIGTIPGSGLRLREGYARFNAKRHFSLARSNALEPMACSCGEILRGIKTPTECALFGKACKPERPVGACMVSTEGSCAAYYKYGGLNG